MSTLTIHVDTNGLPDKAAAKAGVYVFWDGAALPAQDGGHTYRVECDRQKHTVRVAVSGSPDFNSIKALGVRPSVAPFLLHTILCVFESTIKVNEDTTLEMEATEQSVKNITGYHDIRCRLRVRSSKDITYLNHDGVLPLAKSQRRFLLSLRLIWIVFIAWFVVGFGILLMLSDIPNWNVSDGKYTGSDGVFLVDIPIIILGTVWFIFHLVRLIRVGIQNRTK